MNKQDSDNTEYYDVILEDEEGNIRPRKIKTLIPKKPQDGGWRYVGLAGQIGFDIALPMVVGLLAGVKLDAAWGTRPKATLLLFFIGLCLGCASLLRIVRGVSHKR